MGKSWWCVSFFVGYIFGIHPKIVNILYIRIMQIQVRTSDFMQVLPHVQSYIHVYNLLNRTLSRSRVITYVKWGHGMKNIQCNAIISQMK